MYHVTKLGWNWYWMRVTFGSVYSSMGPYIMNGFIVRLGYGDGVKIHIDKMLRDVVNFFEPKRFTELVLSEYYMCRCGG